MPDNTQNGAEKPKRGRPKKAVDLELVAKLAHIQCTYGEIASTLGVSIDTLQRHRDFAATYKSGAEGGRKSLRRMQFESANKGNIAMQIWLGKQYLAQSDGPRHREPTRVELTGKAGGPLTIALLDEILRDEAIEDYKRDFPGLAVQSDHAMDASFSVVKPAALAVPRGGTDNDG